MRISVRKGPAPRDGTSTEPQVIMELWMTTEEAHGLDLNGMALGDAVGAALQEHMPHRRPSSRNVRK